MGEKTDEAKASGAKFMVFRADGMNGKKAKKLFTKMTKAVPNCAFAVVSIDAKGNAALFCACGKEVNLDGGAKKWAATVFPEGRGGGNAGFASSTGPGEFAETVMKRAEEFAAKELA